MVAIPFNTATLTGNYDPFIAGGLPRACSLIRIINNSNVDVGFSYDGINTHEFLPIGSVTQIQFQTNSRPNSKSALLPRRAPVSLIGAAGVGNVWLVGYYQDPS